MSTGIEHKTPAERHFGLLFGSILILIGLVGLWWDWALALCATLVGAGLLFVLAGVLAPRALRLFNLAWYHFGLLLGRIVSPIVLGILFFGLLTPIALLGRMAGRDELRLKRRQASSHWIKREPPGPPGTSFINQY